jgi:hypothetical protein
MRKRQFVKLYNDDIKLMPQVHRWRSQPIAPSRSSRFTPRIDDVEEETWFELRRPGLLLIVTMSQPRYAPSHCKEKSLRTSPLETCFRREKTLDSGGLL